MKSTRLTLILLLMLISIPYTSNTYAQQAFGTDQFQFRTLSGHTHGVWDFVFSPDGQTLASMETGEGNIVHGNQIILWDVATASEKTRFRTESSFTDIVFSPDSQMLAGAERNWVDFEVWYEIILWDVTTGSEKNRFRTESHFTEFVFSPDSQTLAIETLVSEGEYEIILWDVATASEKNRFPPLDAYYTRFSPDGQTLAIVEKNWIDFDPWYEIILWDVATGSEKTTLGTLAGGPHGIVFSSDSQTLAGVGGDTIIVWDVATGRQRATFKNDESLRYFESGRYSEYIALSPDGQTVVGVDDRSHKVILWNVATGRNIILLDIWGSHIERFRPASISPSTIVFSPDGQTVTGISGGFHRGGVVYDTTLALWDVATGAATATLRWSSSVVFSPDGQTLASIRDSTIRLWEMPATQVRMTPSTAESPSIGAKLTINVAIAAGQNVGGYQVTVVFDETALRYVESANGDYLPPGAFAVPPEISDSKVTLAATSLAGTANGDGTLVTLTFEVVDIKESKLILSDVILTDSTGEPLPHRFFSGWVTDPQIGPEDVNSDGVVNILDLVKVASRFNQHRDIEKEDINGDGIVNIVDLVKVAGAIGGGAAAPSLHPQTLAMFTAADVQKWLSAAQQLNLTDATSQRGILFLENLLAALTPKETALLPNYPNPFNPETWIPYQLAEPAEVSISIYTVDGQLVRTLDLGHRSVGNYDSRSRAAYWDGRNALGEPVASGVYFYTLKAGDFSATRKMLIRK